MKSFYMARIMEATTLAELNYIVENAANDLASDADYMEVYESAMCRINELCSAI